MLRGLPFAIVDFRRFGAVQFKDISDNWYYISGPVLSGAEEFWKFFANFMYSLEEMIFSWQICNCFARKKT